MSDETMNPIAQNELRLELEVERLRRENEELADKLRRLVVPLSVRPRSLRAVELYCAMGDDVFHLGEGHRDE